MNVKLKVLTAGALFFIGGQTVMAQKQQKDSVKQKQIEEVVVIGYKQTTKKKSNTAIQVVNNETIENRPNANVVNTLQGQLAGVNITAGTGQPGAKSEVIIRGYSSINGNTDPLYVIDGFPSNADNFRTINPNDIESVSVLKDAAATAQFGNRGTNGVIVIKTRKARLGEGKTNWRYSSQYGMAQLQEPKYTYTNAKDLLRLEKSFGAGIGATLTDAQIDAWTIDSNWVDYFFRSAVTKTHNLSVENISKNISSFTSLGYTEQDGILFSTGLKRFNLRNNINGKSANDKFKYQINTAFGFSKNNEATNLGEGAINRNFVLGAYLSAPYLDPYAYQGPAWTLDQYFNTPGLLATPYMLVDKLYQYSTLSDETRIDVSTEFSYDLTQDLTIRSRVNGLFLSNRFFQAEYPGSFNALLFQAAGQEFTGFEDINQRREFIFNNLLQLDYNKKIGDHTINANINLEYNHTRLHTNNFRQRGLNPLTFVPNTGSGYVTDTSANDFYVPQISASQLRNDLISYFAIADYDFKSKYGLTATLRRDGTSRFLQDYRWGNFWSVGARWNVDEESFMDSFDNINVLKLRASYGITGNQRVINGSVLAGILPPPYVNTFGISNNTYNGGQGYSFSLGYPEIQWEPTAQFNAGVDFELYKSKLRGSVDFYNRKTSNLFLDAPISSVVGATTIRRNSDANLTNSGVELNLAYDVLRTQDMKFTLRANGSYNKNTVGGITSNEGKILQTNSAGYAVITQNGGTIYEPFVYKYLGVNPLNGNLLFEDANGAATETPTSFDRKATGKNFVPVYQGGFGFDFDYKGFFASTTFTYVLDVWRFDTDEENLYDVGNIGQFKVGKEMMNAWTPTNTTSNVPSLSATNAAAAGDSDRFLRDASYVRLRNAQLGYRLPKRLLENTFLTDVSFTIQGENLVTFTKWKGFDAESNRTADFYQYPTPRIYTFGIDIKF